MFILFSFTAVKLHIKCSDLPPLLEREGLPGICKSLSKRGAGALRCQDHHCFEGREVKLSIKSSLSGTNTIHCSSGDSSCSS